MRVHVYSVCASICTLYIYISRHRSIYCLCLYCVVSLLFALLVDVTDDSLLLAEENLFIYIVYNIFSALCVVPNANNTPLCSTKKKCFSVVIEPSMGAKAKIHLIIRNIFDSNIFYLLSFITSLLLAVIN